MALKTRAAEELPSINLTPMIDVVFLLIIFFMVGTQFSERERSIGIKLPGVGQLQTMVNPPDRREVIVTADGQVVVDGQTVSTAELTQRLAAMIGRYPDLRVVVRADGAAQHQSVAAVYAAVDRAGVTHLSMAVRYQPQQTPGQQFR